ncbi:MAG: metallophosphoesterase [Bacteroidetes bacterium]|nr:metallophosphoesterase [Bacteroidota bacterium]
MKLPAFLLTLITLFISGIFTCCSQESHPIITFGIVTDVHYADIPDKDNRAYSQSLDKLGFCVKKMNEHAVDFLIELGDFKDCNSTNSEEKSLIYLYRAEQVFKEFNGPKYHVIGNHDVDCLSKSEFLSQVQNTDIPNNSTYYGFTQKGIHFIVLDANYDSAGRDYEKGKFDWNDPNIPEEELKWLKKELKKASGTTIVFCHQLLDGHGDHYVKNAKEVRKILEKSGKVAAVFQGHYHEGQYHLMNGIHYYTLKALVEGGKKDDNSFAIVSLYPDMIKVKGFKNAVSMQFGLENRK